MAASSVFLVFAFISLIYIVGIWKAFEKAGEPGWAAIVPFYNWWIMLRIARKPAWWFFLMFVPFVNVVVTILTLMGVARNFGEGEGFGLGLFFLGVVFWPMLGYGDQQYLAYEEDPFAFYQEDAPPYDREDPGKDDWDPLADRQKF